MATAGVQRVRKRHVQQELFKNAGKRKGAGRPRTTRARSAATDRAPGAPCFTRVRARALPPRLHERRARRRRILITVAPRMPRTPVRPAHASFALPTSWNDGSFTVATVAL